MSTLTVLLDARVIGHLDRTSTNSLRFAYVDDATATALTPLSLSMPLGGGPFTGPRIERFVRALLPESDAALTAIERRHPGTDRRDLLSVLAVIGQDCPGRGAVLPARGRRGDPLLCRRARPAVGR